MNLKDNSVNGYVDSVKLRLDFIDRDFRDTVYSKMINFIREKKVVAPLYDATKSNEYCQITNLNSSNTTIAALTKSSYPNNTHSIITNYY